MKAYIFSEKLVEGLIKSRPNRFIMNVRIEGRFYRCHCPSTGRIGDIKFNDIPCLLSKSTDTHRKTRFTVEAISVNRNESKSRKKVWIGINQSKANKYIEFFLKSGQLKNIIPGVEEVKREVRLGRSRIDFLVDRRDYVEVKTPLKDLILKGSVGVTGTPLTSFERIIKHFKDISSSIKDGSRAIFLMCYMYDAKPFKVPKPNKKEMRIVRAARAASRKGLKNWQVNLRIDENEVRVMSCFRLELFR
ncbi:MAG: DNA/RNA nuclease SfsA [archaeon]